MRRTVARSRAALERDDTCPYLCVEHAVDNERGAHGERGMHALVVYPHTNRDRRAGVSIYLDLPSADVA